MPETGATPSCFRSQKEGWKAYEKYDSDESFLENNQPIDVRESFGLSSSDDSSHSFPSRDGSLELDLEDRFKPVCLRIIDFFNDFHRELKHLIESGLVFEYEEALIKFMANYKYHGVQHHFRDVEIKEICLISDLGFEETYSRYKSAKNI